MPLWRFAIPTAVPSSSADKPTVDSSSAWSDRQEARVLMKHVLVLNHFAKSPTQPGGNRHIDLFSRLEEWNVRILAADRNNMSGVRQGSSGAEPIAYLRVAGGRSAVARIAGWVSYAVGALVSGMREPRPNVVYASSPHLLAALAGYAVARRWRVPWILEVRDVWPRILVEMGGMSDKSPVYRILRRLEIFLYRRADHVVHLAAGNRPYLIAAGVSEERLSFIPNSVASCPPSLTRDQARAQFNLRGLVVAYTGAHGQANELGLVIDAAEQLEAEVPGLTIILVGDGPEKAGLVTAVERRELCNVRFMDPIAKQRLPDFLAGVDIGLHVLRNVPLFRHGVSPNKIMDYLAAGLPVLTNSPGEAGNVVLEAGAGWVCEPHGLAAGLRRLASLTPEERKRLGNAGRRYVDSQRNPDLMSVKLASVLDRVISTQSA